MIIKEVLIRKMSMTMKSPFSTSFGTLFSEVTDKLGKAGWGESTAF